MQDRLAADELRPALKGLARVKHIQRTLTEQWSVLATLTPSEYARVPRLRSARRRASSPYQYRAVEFLLGNKNAELLDDLRRRAGRPARCSPSCSPGAEPVRRVPALPGAARARRPGGRCCERDVTAAARVQPRPGRRCSADLRARRDAHWEAYEACEELVDLEENFQLWRFRHLKTVERTIGWKRGTGGSAASTSCAGAGPDLLPGAVRGPHRDRSGDRDDQAELLTGRRPGCAPIRWPAFRERFLPSRRTSSPTWTATRSGGRCGRRANASSAFVRGPSGRAA